VCREPDSVRMEGTGNFFGYEGWGITPDKEGLCEVGSVGMGSSGWLQIPHPHMAKEKRMEHLVDERWQLER
jgi:hypothetical protein